MKKWIVILGVVLVAQIGLAAALYMGQEEYAAFEPEETLLSFEPSLVTGLRIETADETLELRKVEGQWQIPRLDGFAADQGKVKGLLEKLARLKKGWPVATTASAVNRFKVADGDFERRITLLKGEDALAQAYFGTSPGFRKVHARAADDNVIVAVNFSLFEANARADDWIDRNVLEVPAADITRVEMPQFTLLYEDAAWRLSDLQEGETMRERAADDLVGKLAALQIDGLFGADAQPEEDGERKAWSFTLTQASGETLRYELTPVKGGNYLLTRSDRKERFKVASWRLSAIEDTTRDKLVAIAVKEEDSGEASEAAHGAGGEDAGRDEAG